MDADRHLQRLRDWRNRREPDLSLRDLPEQFERQYGKPRKELGQVSTVWESLVPDQLNERIRLESFRRGTLTVSTDSSAVLYELQRLLREGLQRDLTEAYRGGILRKVKVTMTSDRLGTVGSEGPDQR